MLRILVVSNLYPPQVIGGYERAIADYARMLALRGHTILVLTANVEGLATSYANLGQVLPVNLKIKRNLSLNGMWTDAGAITYSKEESKAIVEKNHLAITPEILNFQPDVCLAGNMDFLGIEVIRRILEAGIPIAHYVMNSRPGYPPEYAPDTSLYRYITVSDWIRNNLSDLGYPVKAAQTIYPGCDSEKFFQPSLPPRDRLRIVYASLVMYYKGVDLLIEALSYLHVSGLEFTATIAGGSLMPEYVQSLHEFVQSEGLQEQIQFTGLLTQSELLQLYRTNNVWVLPSRFQEPFSIGLLEAMQAGLTIVASNTGGSLEAIEHCETGFIFESENVLNLADILYSLPMNPDIWESITLKGQQKAISQFTRTHTIDRLESLLAELSLLKRKEQ